MSKLDLKDIKFKEDDFVISIGPKAQKSKQEELLENFDDEFSKAEYNAKYQEEQQAKENAQKIVEEAKLEAQDIIEQAKTEAQKLLDTAKQKADEQNENVRLEAVKIKEDAKKEAETLINTSKEEIEKQRVETINNAYKEGHDDGNKKVQEELEEKINFFDDFCKTQYQIEQNILKTASKDILNVIVQISKKVLLKELDGECLKNIIDKTVLLLENKENVNIILSEKYAKILYELQKKSLSIESEFDFSEFKQYENFNIIYSPEYKDDTIIVENFKERFDASITSQLEIIIRDIYEKAEKEKIELEEYKEIHEIN